MDNFNSTKIVDPSLQEFASSQPADEQRSVIVELGVDPPLITLPFDRSMGLVPFDRLVRRDEAGPAGRADVEGHAKEMDELEGQLNSLGLAGKPVRLNAAQAFVVPVTAAQLCALSLLPLAGVIRPNRRHVVPG